MQIRRGYHVSALLFFNFIDNVFCTRLVDGRKSNKLDILNGNKLVLLRDCPYWHHVLV